MDKTAKFLFGFTCYMAFLLPSSISAALVEYSGSGVRLVDGIERNISISLTIDDEFHSPWGWSLERISDHFPSGTHLDREYGRFDIHAATVSIDGIAVDGSGPVTKPARAIDMYITNYVGFEDGEAIYDVSALRPYIDLIATDWGVYGSGKFLDESGNDYDWASWWGDNPTYDLPPVLGISRIDERLFGGYPPELIMLYPHPVPIPAAIWLFGSGLLGFFKLAKRYGKQCANPMVV